MDDKSAKYFGYVIAFLTPGFLGLWAVSYYSAAVAAWLGRASSASTSVGDFLVVVVASVGVGVFVSGVRYILFEELGLFKLPGLKVPERVPDDAEARRLEAPHKQAVHEDIREQFYRFYQFYANTAVALALVFIAWWPAGWIPTIPKWVFALLFFGAEGVLIWSARDSLCKFRRKKAALLGIILPSTPCREEGSSHDQRRRHPEGPTTASPETATAPTKANTGTSAAKADPEKALTPGPER